MKRKAKVRRSRDLPPPDISPLGRPQGEYRSAQHEGAQVNETAAELSSVPATPGRISLESVDEHKTGSIESVPRCDPENGVVGFIEPGGRDAGRGR